MTPVWREDLAEPELLRVFLAETTRRLATVDDLLRELGRRGGHGAGDVPRGLGTALQREGHTIKGGAAVAALEGVRAAAAELEALGRALRDGRATVEEALARGRALAAELRRRCADAPTPSPAQPPTPPASGGGTIRVLCVDDDDASRSALERLLSRRPGAVVLVARDGVEALDVARRLRPQLVFLGQRLAEAEGAAVLAALRADGATRSIPIVVAGAGPAREHAAELLSAGAAAYLEQPLELGRVLELVERVARGRAP